MTKSNIAEAVQPPPQIDVEISSLRKQISAYQALAESRNARIATLQAGRAEWQEAVNKLSSEREANAMLTREIDALRLTLAPPVEVQQAIEAAVLAEREACAEACRGANPDAAMRRKLGDAAPYAACRQAIEARTPPMRISDAHKE